MNLADKARSPSGEASLMRTTNARRRNETLVRICIIEERILFFNEEETNQEMNGKSFKDNCHRQKETKKKELRERRTKTEKLSSVSEHLHFIRVVSIVMSDLT